MDISAEHWGVQSAHAKIFAGLANDLNFRTRLERAGNLGVGCGFVPNERRTNYVVDSQPLIPVGIRMAAISSRLA